MPQWVDLSSLNTFGWAVLGSSGVYEIPFLDRMALVFLICVIGMYFISIYDGKKGIVAKGLEVDASMFKVSTGFGVGALIILAMLVAFYSAYW